jgi:transcriptional regulator with XRE-family HTH domain
MNPGLALARARKRAGLSQRALAQRTGVAQPAIARIEAGRVTPRVDTLDRLLRECGYSVGSERLLGAGVDRTQIRELLRLSPRQRLDRAVADAEGLRRLEAATRSAGGQAGQIPR